MRYRARFQFGRLTGFLMAAMLAAPVMAATVIDIQAPGLATRLMMDERFARVDNAADGSYLLHDRRSEQSYLVLPATQQVMKLNAEDRHDEAKIQLVPKQTTDTRIFGYPTQRYQLFANREYCGEVFASKQAMEHLDVEPMLDAVAELIDQQMSAMGPYIAIIDRCTQASMKVLNYTADIGMPLRIYDAKGSLLSDIVNIDVDTDIDNSVLAYPSEYTMVDSVKELTPTQHALKSARQYSPQLDNAFRTVEKFFQPEKQMAQPGYQPPPRPPVRGEYRQQGQPYPAPYPQQYYR